ncbi:LamG-like jellyroll fold domain-containing protein, partial [Planctomycetota bacterium]
YMIQVWYVDLRNDNKKAKVMRFSDDLNTTGVELTGGGGPLGHYGVGTFIADNTGSQTLILESIGGGNANITAYQIRTYAATLQTSATAPHPSSGAEDVPRDDLILEWKAGVFALSHDVYFGTDFDDVNEATTASAEFKGNQSETTYALDRLEFGATYFWRIDEVNDADGNSPWQGDTWSFEAEPGGIWVAGDLLTATASSQNSADEGPVNTISDVGLNPDGSHSNDSSTMWRSADSEAGEAWIRYDLPNPQKLFEMLVWNHNSDLEADAGFGIKEALVEVSTDGIEFTSLATVELAQAAETAVDMQGTLAQSVRITAQSNWGGIFKKYGLSKVRFLIIPTVARELNPADGDEAVDPTMTVLTWRAGREASVHDVYVSTDQQAVIDGTAPVVTVPETRFVPDLSLGMTYYWRVDEVNDAEVPAVWAGEVQSFSTLHSFVVDDMESYKVNMWETWADGYGDPTNGALVGNGWEATPETETVHEGGQSMPMTYGDAGIQNSWTTRIIEDPIVEDWSKHGIKTLSLYFHGSADNVGGQLYVKINNAQFDYQGAATDIQTAQWFPWTIDLSGITTVNELTIGVSGGSGTIFVDSIHLFPSGSELITPVAPEAANLQVSYAFDGNFNDGSGNGNNGTATGDPAFVTDSVRGQVLSFDGVDDDVSVPLVSVSDEVTIAMWMSIPDLTNFKSAFMSNGWEPNAVHTRLTAGQVEMGINGDVDGATGVTVVDVDTWVHVAYTVKYTATECIASVYLNGIAEGSVTTVVDPEIGPHTVWVGHGRIGAWMNAGGNMARYLTGMVDDVVIYDRDLSAAEIAGLAGRTSPFYRPL